MTQSNHTPTPEIYAAQCDIVRDQSRIKDHTPAIRFQDGGQELAIITLSGFITGHEMSPMEWAKHLVMCCNAHDDLVAALDSALSELESLHGLPLTPNMDYDPTDVRLKCVAALAKATKYDASTELEEAYYARRDSEIGAA